MRAALLIVTVSAVCAWSASRGGFAPRSEFEGAVDELARLPLTMGVNDPPTDSVVRATSEVHSTSYDRAQRNPIPWNSADQCYNGDAKECGREFVELLDDVIADARAQGSDGARRLTDAALRKYKSMRDDDVASGVHRYVFMLLGRFAYDSVPDTRGMSALQLLAAMELLLSRPGWGYARSDLTDIDRRTVGIGRILRLTRAYVPGRMSDEFVAVSLMLGMYRSAAAIMDALSIQVQNDDDIRNWGRFSKNQPLSAALLVGHSSSKAWFRNRMHSLLGSHIGSVAERVLRVGMIDVPSSVDLCRDGSIDNDDTRRRRLNQLEDASSGLGETCDRAVLVRAFLYSVYRVPLAHTAADMDAIVGGTTKLPSQSTSDIARHMATEYCRRRSAHEL